MKISETVLKETVYITIWSLILSLVLEAFCLVAGLWNFGVLFGNLWGVIISVLNFFVMGIFVQRAVEKEEKDAKKILKLSQTLRTFLMFILLTIGVVIPYFSKLTVIISFFFPRIAVTIRGISFLKKQGGDEKSENK